jgi:RND superfamily putative drug exporter
MPATLGHVLRSLGRLIAQRSRWFLLAWVVTTVLGFAAVGGTFGNQALFDRLKADSYPEVPGEAKTGSELLARADPNGPTLQLLLDHVDPASPQVRDAVTAAAADVVRTAHVQAVQQPYSDAAGQPLPPVALTAPALASNPLVSSDRRALLMVVSLSPGLSPEDQTTTLATVQGRLQQLGSTLPGATASTGSSQALFDEFNQRLQTDLKTGEGIALPLSLLVMLVVFGGLLAAGLPIIGAIASIAGGMTCLLGFSHVMDVTNTVPSIVTVLGLGLCIDYGLLLVSRYRDELRHLHDAGDDSPGPEALEEALERTLGTAGRTVTFSAVTIAISMSGLLFFRTPLMQGIGAAGVSVVLVALLVALTLVPALLATAGDRLIRPGVTQRIWGVRRFTSRLGDVAPERGAFSLLARGVQRRPAVTTLGASVCLLALGTPALSMSLVDSGYQMLPTESPQRQFFQATTDRFPAVSGAPVQVVSRAPVAQLQAWGTEVVSTLHGVASAGPVREVGTGADRVTVLDVQTTEGMARPDAEQVARDIAAHRPSFPVYVTGWAAHGVAFLDHLKARSPFAAGLVVLAVFVLLFLMTGSVLVPTKAVIMNIVSLGASFGVLVWVFQTGHLEGLLHFASTGGVETTVPAMVLAFAFGLSMDYEVFLLSRIKEIKDTGATNSEAVEQGLQRSGRIITSAGLIVIIVFAGFASGQLLIVKEVSVAVAVAVAVDTTLVRMILVPATMTLLGEWNWWAPKPLRRLHERFGIRES